MTTEEIEREIAAMMRERGVDYGEAELIVGMKYGELHGDLLSMRPLSEEQRRKRRMTLREVMIELGELDDESDEDAIAASSSSKKPHVRTGD